MINKTKGKIIKIIVFAVVMPTILVVAIIVSSVCLFNYWSSLILTETFHKPFNVSLEPACLFENDESIYFYHDDFIKKYSSDTRLIATVFPDDSIVEIANRSRYLRDVYEGADYVYASIANNHSPFDCKLMVFDKKMNVIKEINFESPILSISSSENFLYCVYNSSVKPTDFSHFRYGLIKYSLVTYEREDITIDLEPNHIFDDGGTMILFQTDPYRAGSYHLYTSDSSIFYKRTDGYQAIHQLFGKIDVVLEGQKVTIDYQNNSSYCMLSYNLIDFYPRLYIKGDCLFFGVREYIDNNECVPGYGACFCHYGRSLLLRFDLTKGTFLEPIEYNKGTILIDYDSDGAQCYYEGAFYNHGTMIKNCEAISINETITIYDKNYLSAKTDECLIFYYNKEFYKI